MNLRIVEYKKKYLKSCADLVMNTWNYHYGFKNLKRKDLIYKFYFLNCENYSEHREIIVNENDEVKGLLFGSIEDESYLQALKYKFKEFKMFGEALFHFLIGSLGDRKIAYNRAKSLMEIGESGEEFSHEFDSEINLFIVSSELRGKGFGRKLMDNYIDFCRRNSLKSSFLWTDLDCSYSFYDKYGFKLYKKFYHKDLAHTEDLRDNGMIYYLDIQ